MSGSSRRDLDKASRLLGNRVDVRQGDVTDARSIRDAIAEDYRAIFFTVAATGGMDGRALFASKTKIREVTYQGIAERGRRSACKRFQRTYHTAPFFYSVIHNFRL